MKTWQENRINILINKIKNLEIIIGKKNNLFN